MRGDELPAILTLALLVTWVRADDTHDTLASDYAALLAPLGD